MKDAILSYIYIIIVLLSRCIQRTMDTESFIQPSAQSQADQHFSYISTLNQHIEIKRWEFPHRPRKENTDFSLRVVSLS